MTLDFGKPIVLTDVVIPSCTDLASLSIDVWVQGEELDGQRFVVASDIGMRSLIMTDIMPPVVCRYLKVRRPMDSIVYGVYLLVHLHLYNNSEFLYPPQTKLRGYIVILMSVCSSVPPISNPLLLYDR